MAAFQIRTGLHLRWHAHNQKLSVRKSNDVLGRIATFLRSVFTSALPSEKTTCPQGIGSLFRVFSFPSVCSLFANALVSTGIRT